MFLKISDKKKKYLILAAGFLALVLILSAVVMAVGYMLHRSFGWFAANESVSGTDMSVHSTGDLFEIAAVKVTGNATAAKNIEQRSGLTAPSQGGNNVLDYLKAEGGYDVLYEDTYGPTDNIVNITNNSDTAIFFRFSNENTGGQEIKPGDFGKLSFDIVPKVDYDLNLSITFEARGIKVTSNEVNNQLVPVYTFLDEIAVPTEDETAAMDLLKGHILFFMGREQIAGTAEYHYSDHLTSGTFTYNTGDNTPITDVGDGRDHYRIEVYWIWPSTYSQIVFEEGDERLYGAHALFDNEPAVPDPLDPSERQEMLDFMEDYGSIADGEENYFFHNCALGFDQDEKSTKYIEYSDGYNNADQIIGDNVHYIVAAVTVDPIPES
ncbi:MAG: hypothetical protein IJS45_10545 [Clostridia bacterium]|nr:hypothetical protein [Clostridia bacterium]